jgi:hypothetical protein
VAFTGSSGNCLFKAEVTEVTPTEATFLIEVRDAKSGAMTTTAEYELVVVNPIVPDCEEKDHCKISEGRL